MVGPEKKTVLITGCSTGGIGEALAFEYHSRGYRVFATSRTLESMESLAAHGIETLVLDVVQPESIQEVKQQISKLTGGKLNVLVNNAGIGVSGAVSDLSMKEVRETFNVNLFGVMEMTHEFIPLLLAASEATIINISSVAARAAVPFGASYNASKAALVAFGDTIVDSIVLSVKVMSVIAGGVKSNILRPFSFPDDSLYRPLDEEYQRLRVLRFTGGAISGAEFAKSVISEASKARPSPHFWTATGSWMVWFVTTFLSTSRADKILSDLFGVTTFNGMIKRGEVKKPNEQ